MGRLFALLFAALTISGARAAAPAAAVDAPIGRLGEPLRVELMGLVADVTVHDILPSDVPPGFGYPPRAPRYQVYRANITVHVVETPARTSTRPGVRVQGRHPDRRRLQPRNSDAPDALQYAIAERCRSGATANGGVWWDCYRDLVSNVVLVDKKTGVHLAQWNRVTPSGQLTADSQPICHELADVAAQTFPLACPPSVSQENVAAFIDET